MVARAAQEEWAAALEDVAAREEVATAEAAEAIVVVSWVVALAETAVTRAVVAR